VNVVLLDTHALLWWLNAPERLSPTAAGLIENRANTIVVSVASYWETAIKKAIGKLNTESDVQGEAQRLGVREISIEASHAWATLDLPEVIGHKDPFDRMLAAQAMVEGLPILSSDTVFDAYGVERVW